MSTDLALSGLASGFDWKALVDKLVEVERAPARRLRTEQSQLQQRNAAFAKIETQVGLLQKRLSAINEASFFDGRTPQVSNAALASASAGASTALGTYAFSVSQYATAARLRGATNTGGGLSDTADVSEVALATAPLATAVTAGTFTVDGGQVTVEATDTLEGVLTKIRAATLDQVTGSYDPTTDTIKLTKATGEVLLGSGADTSNFLDAMKLSNNGLGTVTSGSALGVLRVGDTLEGSNFTTALSGTEGEFKVNGVSITWSGTDKLADVLARINTSAAGVTAGYDAASDRFLLTSKVTGDLGVTVTEGVGNFLQATGLDAGAFDRGQDLLYTVNGGDLLRSHGNTVTGSTFGADGLNVALQPVSLAPGGATDVTVTVAADTGKIKTALLGFLEDYNKTQSMIDSYTASSTDAEGKVTAGVLAAESGASEIGDRLRGMFYKELSGLSGAIRHLDDLGITSNGNDNQLALSDEAALDKALTNNLNDVKALFVQPTSGLAVQLSAYVEKMIGDGGSLASHQAVITRQIGTIDTQVADMERHVQAVQGRLTNSFIAMELAQARMNQQMEYLQKTFA